MSRLYLIFHKKGNWDWPKKLAAELPRYEKSGKNKNPAFPGIPYLHGL
jgi:hypothetical protein